MLRYAMGEESWQRTLHCWGLKVLSFYTDTRCRVRKRWCDREVGNLHLIYKSGNGNGVGGFQEVFASNKLVSHWNSLWIVPSLSLQNVGQINNNGVSRSDYVTVKITYKNVARILERTDCRLSQHIAVAYLGRPLVQVSARLPSTLNQGCFNVFLSTSKKIPVYYLQFGPNNINSLSL